MDTNAQMELILDLVPLEAFAIKMEDMLRVQEIVFTFKTL
jgi:hypothetical protein